MIFEPLNFFSHFLRLWIELEIGTFLYKKDDLKMMNYQCTNRKLPVKDINDNFG